MSTEKQLREMYVEHLSVSHRFPSSMISRATHPDEGETVQVMALRSQPSLDGLTYEAMWSVPKEMFDSWKAQLDELIMSQKL